MQIGLIGGIGPAATDYYYRRLISSFAENNLALDLTIVHADTPTLLSNLIANNQQAQVAIYQSLTDRLQSAGAQCVVVTSISGHFCIEAFTEVSSLPVINMLTEVSASVCHQGYQRIGILGTKTVMESRFYGGITSADVVPPSGTQLDEVHQAYAAMAARGQVTTEEREIFDQACDHLLVNEKVDAIMLGGTDLALVYDESSDIPIIDCAGIHADAILRRVKRAQL